MAAIAWILSFQLLVQISLASRQDTRENFNNYFGGLFEDECGNDGFYYLTEQRYVICEGGYFSYQDCAPGSRSLQFQQYPKPGVYRDIVFCNVNLVDQGYTAMNQPKKIVPMFPSNTLPSRAGSPSPVETSNPVPSTVPVPVPSPGPVPVFSTLPVPSTFPKPVTNPAPVPVPVPTLFPVLVPATAPSPIPAPVKEPSPVPTPVTTPSPVPAPAKVPFSFFKPPPPQPIPEMLSKQPVFTFSDMPDVPFMMAQPAPDDNDDASSPTPTPSFPTFTHATNFGAGRKHSKAKNVSYTFYFLHNLKGQQMHSEKVWGIPQNSYV